MALSGRFLAKSRILANLPRLTNGCWRAYKFLPTSVHLDEEWKDRLNAPLMQQIRLEEFYVELRKKFDGDGSGSSLDVEIFLNKAEKTEDFEKIREILAGLRRSKNLTSSRPGIFHALVRIYLGLDAQEEFLPILADKRKFGVFLDSYGGNLLMDKFLSTGNTAGAVKIALEFMWQENFGNPVTRDLALVSCLTFLENPAWEAIAVPPEPVPEETGEEVIVYVAFLKNPWFDDHFDLKDPKQLLGKTLWLAGQERPDLLGNSCKLLGFSLHGKWIKGVQFLQKLTEAGDADRSVLKVSVDAFLTALEAVPPPATPTASVTSTLGDTPPYPKSPLEEPEDLDMTKLVADARNFVGKLQAMGAVKDGSVLQLAEEKLKESIASWSPKETLHQKVTYARWTSEREEEVDLQIQRYNFEERLRELDNKRRALASEEDYLFFFERKDQWEKLLTPEAREEMKERQVEDGSFYDYRVQDAGYEVPQIKEPQTYRVVPHWDMVQRKFDRNLYYLQNR